MATWAIMLSIVAILGTFVTYINLKDQVVDIPEAYDDSELREDIAQLEANTLSIDIVRSEVTNQVRSEFRDQRNDIFDEVNDQLDDFDFKDDVRDVENDLEDCGDELEEDLDDMDVEDAVENLADCLQGF